MRRHHNIRPTRLRLERLEDRTVPTTFAWIGGAHTDASHTSGDPTAWTNALNWLNTSTGKNNAGVPGASDTATFSSIVSFTLQGGIFPVPFFQPFTKDPVYNVAGGGAVGALTFDSTWAGTFTVNQSLTTSGASRWDSGTISVAPLITFANTGNLIMGNFSPVVLSGNGDMYNATSGTVFVTGAGGLFIDSTTPNATRFVNHGTFDLRSDASISSHSTGTIANTGSTVGVLRKSVGAGGTAASVIGNGIALSNNETIDVQQGVLTFAGSTVTSPTTSTMTVASGAVLELVADGATSSYQGVFNGSGAGVIRIGRGTLQEATNTKLQLAGDTTFNFAAGLLHWTGSTIIDTNDKTLTNAGILTIDQYFHRYHVEVTTLLGGGTLSNTGTIVKYGELYVDSYQVGNRTELINQPGGVIDLADDDTNIYGIYSLNGILINRGILRKSGVSVDLLCNRLDNVGTFEVQSGHIDFETVVNVSAVSIYHEYQLNAGTWIASNNSSLDLFPYPTYDHSTIVRLAGGAIVLDGAGSAFMGLSALRSIDNGGRLTIQNGNSFLTTVGLVDGGTLTVGAGSTFTAPSLSVASGGTLTGAGTVAGPVSNAGTVSPGAFAGVLTINGNYSQATGGSLAIELNGTTPGTAYDQLKVNGSVSLGGTLALTIGFTPALATKFTIVENDGTDVVAGAFANLPQNAQLTVNGLAYQINYTGGSGNDVVLTRVNPPSVTAVGVNAGAQQRSRVMSIQVTFSTAVTLAPTAFTLTYVGTPGGATGGTVGSKVGGFSVATLNSGGVTVATLFNFGGADTLNGSLIDGRYALTVDHLQVTANGLTMASDFTYADGIGSASLYRLYGDANGDRVVNGADLTSFVASFGGPNSTFDFDADSVVNGADLTEFIKRFGQHI